MSSRALTAVIWDFDGTLVDSRRRNFHVVRRILSEVTDRPLASFPALADWQTYDRVNRRYANWRDLYVREFGFSEDATDRIGRMWTRYQMEDDTAAPVNVGNLINSSWGVRNVANATATSPLTLTRFDANGVPVFNFTGRARTYIDDPACSPAGELRSGCGTC